MLAIVSKKFEILSVIFFLPLSACGGLPPLRGGYLEPTFAVFFVRLSEGVRGRLFPDIQYAFG